MSAPAFLLYATVWLSVFAWAGAELLKSASRRSLARRFWMAGAVLLAVHTAIAFEVRHAWSHAAALEATARQSEVLTGVAAGWGLYLNYAVVLVWIADAAWWGLRPWRYETRPRWIDVAIFGLFLFMMFNGAVLFATTPMRFAGAFAIALVVLARLRGGTGKPAAVARPANRTNVGRS